MKKILYIGPFIFPDGNAAANRVLGIGKVLKEIGYEVIFFSEFNKKNTDLSIEKYKGFKCYFKEDTSNQIIKKRLERYCLNDKVAEYIRKNYKDVESVIIYNFPVIATVKIMNLCEKYKIKLIGDCTEWYDIKHQKGGIFHPFSIDSEFRMRYMNKKIRNMICISEYLENIYKKTANTIRIPALIDSEDEKWESEIKRDENIVSFIYSGSPAKKDLINDFIEAFIELSKELNNIELNLVGFNENLLEEKISGIIIANKNKDLRLKIWGRVSHKEAIRISKNCDITIFFRENKKYSMAGFPSKVPEALMCGNIVLTNKTSNLSKYLNGYNLLIDNVNKKNIINAMRTVIERVEENQDVKNESEKLARKYFDYKNYTEDFKSFMKNLK